MRRAASTRRALSVGQARRFLLAKLPAVWGDDADRLVLMVSELATNAVQHAATEFEVAVRVSPDRERVRVEVSDVAAGYPTPLEPALDALHGRGLHIVRCAGRRLGHRGAPRPPRQDGVVLGGAADDRGTGDMP